MTMKKMTALGLLLALLLCLVSGAGAEGLVVAYDGRQGDDVVAGVPVMSDTMM